MVDVVELERKLNSYLDKKGFNGKFFNVGWYNEKVDDDYKLNYADDTIGFNIINRPDMFELTFLPFIANSDNIDCTDDILDFCIDGVFKEAVEIIKPENVILIRDSHMNNVTRQPKVIVRIAGHVAGQVHYYQRGDVANHEEIWGNTKIYGCSLHSEYGGWFAFRGVMLFPDIHVSLPLATTPDPLYGNQELLTKVLEKFNFSWRDWEWRDVVSVKKRYSLACRCYFSVAPGPDRYEIVNKWREYLRQRCHDDKKHNNFDDAKLFAAILI